jgi:hypothetical protein
LFDAVGKAVTRKVPFLEPAGMVMLAGTVAALIKLLVRFTVVDDAIALWSLTVPVTPFPPGTVVLFNATLASNGRRIRLALWLVTADVVIAKWHSSAGTKP